MIINVILPFSAKNAGGEERWEPGSSPPCEVALKNSPTRYRALPAGSQPTPERSRALPVVPENKRPAPQAGSAPGAPVNFADELINDAALMCARPSASVSFETNFGDHLLGIAQNRRMSK